nr:SGNH/GDSL hydrolase family protein [uncultured Dongia sp.]
MKFRSFILIYVVAVAISLAVFMVPSVHAAFEKAFLSVTGMFDGRPVETVLVIGNSRAYYNDMPDMLDEMADSANLPVRYDVTVRAWAGATFEQNWNDAETRQLLTQHWDHVILQAESAAHGDDTRRVSFQTNGAKLIAAAQATKSPVAVIVNWVYAAPFFADAPAGSRALYLARIQEDYRTLAQKTGVDLINTAIVWEDVLSRDPKMPLYHDTNHPSIHGSYLSALMIYGFLSATDVGSVAYVPGSVDDVAAVVIKDAVRRHYH